MNKEIYTCIGDRIAGLKKPLIVGINGAYTSGKTVFADDLQKHLRHRGLKTQLIHYDDFHNPFSAIHWADGDEIEAFYNRAFNPEKLVREVLAPFQAQGYLNKDIACVNLGTGKYTNTIHFDMDHDTIVLLEGVLLFRPPLLAYLDYKIYLDIRDDEILKRGRLRDVPRFGEAIMEKFIARYIPVQHRYLQECDPRKAADIVIDNNDYSLPRIIG